MTRAKTHRQTLPKLKTRKRADRQPALLSNDGLPSGLLPLVLVGLTLLTFLPVLSNEFVSWDDEATLVNNLRYRGLGWQQLHWMFSTFYLGHYQPLSWVTFAVDYLIWGMRPQGYHLTNLALHAGNTVVFYWVVLRLFSSALSSSHPRRHLQLAAGFSALLFAIHPLRVESVAWATERRDVLSGLFFLLTILCYLQAVADENYNYRRRLGLALLAYSLSLLSKATGMTLPLVLLLLDIYPLKRLGAGAGHWFGSQQRKVWLEKVPFLLLALLCGTVALFAQREAGALRTVTRYEIPYRAAQAFFGIVFYLWKTIVPLGLSPLYEAPYYVDVTGFVLVLSMLTFLGLSAFFWWIRGRWPAGWVSWAYYLFLLAPVLGIAQSGPQLVADRYSYLSCLSWAIVAGGGLLWWWRAWTKREVTKASGYFVMSSAAMLILTLALLTWQQVQVWHDSERLWKLVLSVTPKSSLANNNIGNLLVKRGAPDEALPWFRNALEINPRLAEAHYNIGNVFYRRGNLDQAIQDYRDAVKIRPNYPEAQYNLAVALAKLGHVDEAEQRYRLVLRLDPDHALAHNNLGNLLLMRGETKEAMEHYREALRSEPELAAAKDTLHQLEMMFNSKR